jgi:hypothetical protein
VKCITKTLALLALSAAPAFAEDEPTDAQYDAFVTAITANDCEMTEAEAEMLLPSVGLDQDTSGMIAEELIDEDLAELSEDGETFYLLTEECDE